MAGIFVLRFGKVLFKKEWFFPFCAAAHRFPGQETSHEAIERACLFKFLPALSRETLEREMSKLGIEKSSNKDEEQTTRVCKVEDGKLFLANCTGRNLKSRS